ncbi:hypothetical protein VMCG_06727 [Cytospora schulzeri]|uniref:Uncharacterized protein n=1 Tax=Cytospora schulzeri TaxID=448051 RepID=A0A423W686_9PEZI|nr:hypothetical protein VMCG_06727 [Valsa malicola]
MKNTSRQLVLSGRLKPQVRLGVAISEFAQALDEDRKSDFRQMQNASGNQLLASDVIKVTEEINKDGGRRHAAWRSYGTRVHGFLSRLQMFANVGDVMIGGSQNLIATGVWCAAATNFLGYFEKLSTLFMKLGTSWTLHKDYADLFTGSEVLQNHLCEYFIVLMKLCQRVVLFTRKGLAAQLFSTLGSSFDAEFGTIQKELEERGYIIQQTAQHLATKSFLGATRSKANDFKYRTLQRLSPGQAQYDTTWRRQRRKGNCNWIRGMQDYKAWRAMRRSSTMHINGKLGSGKTVAMANIAAEINIEQPCAFFFCTFKEPDTLKAVNVLGSIAFHLLNNLPDGEVRWNELAAQSNALSGILSSDGVVDLILEYAPRNRRYSIVVDGLEDCLDDDVNEIVLGLRRLVDNLTILLSYSARSGSQFERRTTASLPAEFCVSLDEAKHEDEMKAYIMKEVRRRNATGQLSNQLEGLVIETLKEGSQGMYLWVSLQLDAIFPSDAQTVTTDEQILSLITNLPRDLPEAFERALEGITDKKYQGNIMKLVMAAVSPLTLDELRVALTITPGEPMWRPARVPHDGSQLVSLCGGNLLELDEEDNRVRFIHHSVMIHLLSTATRPDTCPYHFSGHDAENFIGSVCVTYLNLTIFDSRLTMTRNISGDELTAKVELITKQEPGTAFVGRVAQYFMSRERTRSAAAFFDIGRVASEIQAMRLQDHLDPLCFKGYAFALETGQRDMVELLGKHGAVNIPMSDGTSLLWIAIQHNMDDDWISLLLRLGADTNAGPFPTDDGSGQAGLLLHPLQAALDFRKRSRVRQCVELVAYGADVCPSSGPEPLDLALWNDNDFLIATFRELGQGTGSGEQHKPPQDIQRPTALVAALRMLLSYSAGSPTVRPLSGWRRNVVVSLAHTEELNAQDHRGDTALHYLASQEANSDYVEVLLRHGADPNIVNDSGQTPLAIAFSRHAAFGTIIYPLLKSGANLAGNPLNGANSRDKDGNTVLHYLVREVAAWLGIEFLLDKGANPNIANHLGETPVHVAARAGLGAMVNLKVLLNRGGNPNSKTLKGETPLHFAICSIMATTTAIRMLVKAGANPNDVSEIHPQGSLECAITGFTGLHFPRFDRSEVIALLLKAGADPLVPASTGGTLAELARNPGVGDLAMDLIKCMMGRIHELPEDNVTRSLLSIS